MKRFLCVFICVAGTISAEALKGYTNSRLESVLQASDTFRTYVWTPGGMILFSYQDSTELQVFDSSSNQVWSGVLDADEYNILAVETGVYEIVGYGNDYNHSILVGSYVGGLAQGWYAIDQYNRGVSQKLLTMLPGDFGVARFVIFAYEDNTSVEVRDLSDGTLIDKALLDKGENLTIIASTPKFVKVTADKGVAALSYDDQGYWIPADNGTFTGTLFYTWVGFIENWQNDLNIVSYNDGTHVTVKDTEAETAIWEGDLNEGTVHTVEIKNKYVTIESDKNVSCLVAPFENYTGPYYRFYIGMEMLGEGIGIKFYHPTVDGCNLYVLSYHDNNKTSVYNITHNMLVWQGSLDKGELRSFDTDKVLYRIEGKYDISVFDAYSSGDNAGAEFAPVMVTIHPDVSLMPNQEQSTRAGVAVKYQVAVENNGNRWDIIDLVSGNTNESYFTSELSDSSGIPLGDANDNDEEDTGVLPSGETFYVTLKVMPALTTPIGTIDTCMLIGVSHQNPERKDTAFLVTRVNEVGVEEDSPPDEFEYTCDSRDGILKVSLNNIKDEYAEVTVLDVSGRKVYSEKVLGTRVTLDVSGLSKGVYFVSARTGHSMLFVKKAVIIN